MTASRVSQPSGDCRAVIDVGTNSIKLLVGCIQDGSVTPLLERGIQTRLGTGLFESGRLEPLAIERTAAAAADFRATADRFQPSRLRVVATAAAREAANRSDLIQALRSATGVAPEIISGALEADLAFRGVCSDPRWHGTRLLVTDLGGGSTEFILGRDGAREFDRSFPIGAVRFHARLAIAHNPTPDDLRSARTLARDVLTETVLPHLSGQLRPPNAAPPVHVATGGTAAILARIERGLESYDRDRIESDPITMEALRCMTDHLWGLPLEARRQVRGLPPERADIILAGCVLHEAMVHLFHLGRLHVSTRGLRFGLLLAPA